MTRYRGTVLGALLMLCAIAKGAVHARRASNAPDINRSSGSRAAWLHPGTPDIARAGVLAFTSDGILLVGDSPSSAIFALDVGDTVNATGRATDTVSVRDIDQLVAARLGTTTRNMTVNDMAVHPRSHAIYLSVSRGLGRNMKPAIVRIRARGKVDLVSLTNIPFAKTALPNAPMAGAKDEDGDDAFGMAITGLAVTHGAVYLAGLTNDEFSSTLRMVPLPFGSRVTSTGVRIYHAHHSRFETRSPITALAPYSERGRDYLLASYACTPLVLIPLDSLKDGARVTGTTIAELGAGTHATDLVSYGWQGRRYLAVSTLGRSLQLLEADSLAALPALDASSNPTKGSALGSWHTWGAKAYTGARSGVLSLADFDSTYAVVVQRDVESGALNLRPLKKPILW